jgi:DNA invertase Pin-like site-specific DNA recombinase
MKNRRLYVAYYRVSTKRQGESGLGLEAQQTAVNSFAGEPLESYTEIESGKRTDRPQLAMAIVACKRLGATLVIAKLDRLARNVHFVSGLMESGIEFVACDNPNASRLTVHILAAVAEDEARRISERTKAALAAYKARGGRLGNPKNLTTVAARKGAAANAKAGESHRKTVKDTALGLRAKGYSLAAIAETLTGRGLLTRRGKAWSPTAVKRLLA